MTVARTRRALLAAVVGLPVAAGIVYAVRKSNSDSELRQALRRFEARYGAALAATAGHPTVADALERADVKALDGAIVPLRVAHRVDLIDVVGADGKMVSAFRAERFGERALLMVDPSAGTWSLTLAALRSDIPATPTPATVVKTAWGDAVYRASPITQSGRVVGAVLVGTPLEDALKP